MLISVCGGRGYTQNLAARPCAPELVQHLLLIHSRKAVSDRALDPFLAVLLIQVLQSHSLALAYCCNPLMEQSYDRCRTRV